MPFYERQPYIMPLYQVLLELLRGEIRVPRFQRPGTEIVWKEEQRGDLLDSLYRGFPVGTILLWSTTSEIKCLERVAGFRIPELHAAGRPTRVLLDGHQRLSALLAILGPGLESEVAAVAGDREDVLDETWVFETRPKKSESVGRGHTSAELNNTRECFFALKKGQSPSDTQVPLSILLDRVRMNRWIREHAVAAASSASTGEAQKGLNDEEVRAAEAVRDKLREYSLPVAVLVTDSLEDAAESFKRVNSSGTPMGTFHMVKALAYSEEFDLEASFEEQ